MNYLTIYGRIHNGDKPYFCDICGKQFANMSNLNVHRRTHTGEKPHVCDLCGKCFARRRQLSVHQRTHTEENPFICNVCGKGFAQCCTLSIQKLTHSVDNAHVCRKCGKSTHSLTTHEGSRFRETANVCNECDHKRPRVGESDISEAGLTHRGPLDNNAESHIEEENCVCDICGKKLIDFDNFRFHALGVPPGVQ